MSRVVKAVVGVALVVAGVLTGNFQLILTGAMLVGGAILQPKGGKPRAAATAQLQIGEVPRQAIVGRAATAGSLVDAFNYGGKYGTDWEVLVIALADHRTDALEGFYVNDVYVNFAGDGMVAGYNNQLAVYFRNGTENQSVPAILTANGPGWTANDNGAGVTHVTVAYKADAADAKNPVWPNGRPRFLWVLKGALCYDPRKDSTVGGVGAHRWLNPATWEWSDNPIVTRYKFARGFYACDRVTQPEQILVGRGLSAVEAPPANLFARANLCDEIVDGEPRYRVGGLIEANEPFIDVESDFAAACAGTIVQPEGAVEIDPGEARAAVLTITDDDLVVGSKVKRRWFLGIADREWVNSVVANYIEPAQKWSTHAAPVRRDIADIQADGAPREESLQLGFVTWAKQAGRIAEIVRRLGRLPIRAELVLPPRLCELEEGDWVIWQSDRYLKGQAYTFRVDAWGSDRSWQHSVVLRQISASCYSDTAPLTDGSVAVLQPPRDPIGAPNPANWALAAGHLDAGSIRTPALIVTGATNDPAAAFVRIEYIQSVAAPTGASVWSDAGVTGPDIKRREIAVAAGGTYWVAISYVVDGVPGDRLILGPVVALAVTYPDGTPVENVQPGEAGATNDANLDDPTQLVINEKIRLVTSEPTRANRRSQVRARMVELGLSVAALDAAEVNWLAYRNAIAPAWDNVAQHSTISRATWNTLSQAFDAALDAGDKAISEEDARRANWNLTNGRPPLLTGEGSTVDEFLKDPSVWQGFGYSLGTDATGEGFVATAAGGFAQFLMNLNNATPIDHQATYQATWDLYEYEPGGGAPTGAHYCVVMCWDSAGNVINGDGTHWFYPFSYEAVQLRNTWETRAGLFGKGTARPFPANAVKFGVGVLLNYAGVPTIVMQARRFKTRKLASVEMTSPNPNRWVIGDGKAIRVAGTFGWGNIAYGRAPIVGPQRFTWRPARTGAAHMVGLTDQSSPANFEAMDGAFYLQDNNNLQIYENGVGVTGTVGTCNASTELAVEYDGLRLNYFIDGVKLGYSSIVGENKSFRMMVDSYYLETGFVGGSHTAGRTLPIVGGNTVDASGNAWIGANGATSDIQLTLTGANIVASGNSVRRTVTGSWDAQAYTANGFTGGAVCSFVPENDSSYFMAGLNSDPTTNASFDTIDFAFHMNNDGSVYCFESGSFGANFGAYAAGMELCLYYDNEYVHHLINGREVRSTYVGAGRKYHFDSSIVQGGALTNIKFGPYSPAASSVSFINANGQSSEGNMVFKRSNATTGWNSKSVSREVQTGTAFVSGRLDSPGTFIGLHTVGHASPEYGSFTASFHRSYDGNTYVFTGYANVQNLGATPLDTNFTVTYDGAIIRCYQGPTLVHTITSGITANMSFNAGVAIDQANGDRVSNIQFGPFTDRTWGNIVGGARPEDYSTSADNMVKNGSLRDGVSWGLSGGSSIAGAGAGEPVAAYIILPATVTSYATANDGKYIQTAGAKKIHFSGLGATAGASYVVARAMCYDATAAYLGYAETLIIPSSGSWVPVSGVIDLLANTTQVVLQIIGAGNAGQTFIGAVRFAKTQAEATANVYRGNYAGGTTYNVGDTVLWTVGSGGDGKGYGRIGSGATVGVPPSDTSKWAVLVDRGGTGAAGVSGLTVSASPPAWPIACTFNGTPKATVQGFQITVYRDGVDVSAGATYGTPVVSGLSGVAVDGDGTVTTTGMTADTGYILIPVTYGGATANIRVDYTKVKDGNAAVSGSANVTALTNVGTYATSANFNISLANGQTFSASANVAYGVVSATYGPQVKLAYVNVTDGGAETDMSGSEVTGPTVLTAGDIENVSTSGSFTNSTGGTKTYNIRLLSRRAVGAGNSTSVSGSVGGSG